jgi:hypothetical protein
MDKLKPCPFCGGEAELKLIGRFQYGLSANGWIVRCVKGCCRQLFYASDHDAIEAWNRRKEQ